MEIKTNKKIEKNKKTCRPLAQVPSYFAAVVVDWRTPYLVRVINLTVCKVFFEYFALRLCSEDYGLGDVCTADVPDLPMIGADAGAAELCSLYTIHSCTL